MNLFALLLLAHPLGLLAALASLALVFGTVATVPHPNPIIPSTSPDASTVIGQGENLRVQFEVLTGTSDVIQGGGGSLSALPNQPATPVAGTSFINSAGVNATTLATPVAGDPAAGGNDGLTIEIIDIGGHAHTVTTAANKINGNHHILTFPGTVGARVQLKAFGGVWYTDGGGTVIS